MKAENNVDRCCENDAGGQYLSYVIPLTDRARDMRLKGTKAEEIFWRAVRRKRLCGLKFIRQKPLLGYIADFYCAELKLVIEIDGGIHDHSEEYDRRRSAKLNDKGITVLRFKNEQIINDLRGVLSNLKQTLSSFLPPGRKRESLESKKHPALKDSVQSFPPCQGRDRGRVSS